MTLPKQFELLTRIRPIETRLSLVSSVESILSIRHHLRLWTWDDRFTSVIHRFMSYLETSCASGEILLVRQGWLLRYAKAIEYLLQEKQYQTIRRSVPVDNADASDVSTALYRLIDLMAMVDKRTWSEHDLSLVNDLLESILADEALIEVREIDAAYLQLLDDSILLCKHLEESSICQTILDAGDVIASLKSIYHHVRRYIVKPHQDIHT